MSKLSHIRTVMLLFSLLLLVAHGYSEDGESDLIRDLESCRVSVSALADELKDVKNVQKFLVSKNELVGKVSILFRSMFALFVHVILRFTGFDIRTLANPESDPRLQFLTQAPASNIISTVSQIVKSSSRVIVELYDKFITLITPVLEHLNKFSNRLISNLTRIDPSLKQAYSTNGYDAILGVATLFLFIYLFIDRIESCLTKLGNCLCNCCCKNRCTMRSVSGVQTHASRHKKTSASTSATDSYTVDQREVNEARRRLSAR